MIIKWENDAKFLRYNPLRRVAELAFAGELTQENIDHIPYEQIPGVKARFRCCVYKEREIVTQRVRLAMGKAPLGGGEQEHNVCVLPAACEGCTIHHYRVTENCQRCLVKSCITACPFDAISISGRGAYIDQDKCKECGRCAKACPYNAIAELTRPCRRACPVDAISFDEDKIATIKTERCLSCGACIRQCPFSAVADKSYIVPIIERLRAKAPTVAIFAPAIEGQFGGEVAMGQIKAAARKLGFTDCFEVALGADAVSYSEAHELEEALEAGRKMTTSCCPAFFNLIKKHFPKVEAAMSTTISPMAATARWIKARTPEAKVVFIGPCVAKKSEAERGEENSADWVMTSEEFLAMLEAKGVDPSACEVEGQDGSIYGKCFAASGGVTASVLRVFEEEGKKLDVSCQRCNGGAECKQALQLLAAGKLTVDFIEGMACEGGCGGGPFNIQVEKSYKQARTKLLKQADNRTITENVKAHGLDKLVMHRES